MVKRLIKELLLKLTRAAAAYEVELARQRSAKQVSIGRNSVVDYSKIALKEGATLRIADDSMIIGTCIFDRPGSVVEIGSRTYFDGNINCAARVTIGDDVLVSSSGMITDHNSHALMFSDRRNDVVDYMTGLKDWSNVKISQVTIGSKVWIGYNVIILPGVTIGEGAVIGAGAVVTRSIPPYSLAAGNPARVIRSICERVPSAES